VHIEAVGEAQRGKRHHNASDFLRRVANVTTIDVIDELVRFVRGAAA